MNARSNLLIIGVVALVAAWAVAAAEAADTPLPVVLWHGMGDTCCLPFSMGKVKKTIEEEIDGIYVYSIELGGEEALDWIMGFFANMDDQVQHICDKLAADPKLAGGFNAIGFSQGGQFLRAYVERCNSPPVKNLITFGGQHMGVDDFPECVDTNDTICRLAAEAFGLGAYLPEIRHDLVQAQYYRDVMDYTGYLKYNEFLADINNELPTKNATYKANLMSLENLVLIKFEKDTVVVPRDSEWFGYYEIGSLSTILPMEDQTIYKEDWIGLQELNKAGNISRIGCPGNHMDFTMEYLTDNVINPYLK